MRKNKQLGAGFAAALMVASLAGASAFADSRPAHGTRGESGARGNISRDHGSRGGEVRRGNETSNRAPRESGTTIERRGERPDANSGEARSYDRTDRTTRIERGERGETRTYDRTDRGETRTYDRGDRTNRGEVRSGDSRTYDRNRSDRGSSNRGGDTWRGGNSRGSDSRGGYNRGGDSRGGYNRGGYNRGGSGYRQPYYHNGRVSRVQRYGSGYRVYIIGSPYPFFVPYAYWRADRFRVGLSIRLGGYYNPLGYYDYYDGYADGRAYSSEGTLRGVVESVDYRRDTMVIRNDATGSFVTVAIRDRRRDDVRAGDYVELYGDWTRSGLFEAYDVDLLDDARR